MCGICGVFSYDSNPGVQGPVRAMNAQMTHRGPDQDGFLFDGPIGLGHRRLSIIDLEGGKQPIPDEGKRIWAMLNGEIYNFRELRRDLEGRHRFRTESDTEVLVHLYEEKKEAFVELLNGMFALAIWDSREETLLLARDRLGIKPLYYTEQPERFLFASEIKALIASPWVDPQVRNESVYAFLRLKYVPGPDTIYRGIRRLEPGTLMRVRRDGITRRRYWQIPPVQAPPRKVSKVAEEIRFLLEDSVRRRLVADVPVGLLLSGGIDSTALLGILHQNGGSGAKTFSVGFPNFTAFDETVYARKAASRFQADHSELQAEVEGLPDLLFRLAWHMDEPISDPAIFPTYILCRYASKNVKVALSGEGADELFAGYNKYWKDRWLTRFRRLPRPVRSAGLGLIARMGKGSRRWRRIGRRLQMPAGIQRHLDWSALFSPEELRELSGGFFGPREEDRLQENLRSLIPAQPGDPLDAALRIDLCGSLANSLLMKVDKIGMACSLEVRVPYLDHRLVELAATLPASWKVRHGDNKWVLKQAIGDLLPRSIRDRPKHGFDVPVSAWLRDGLRETARRCLGPESVVERRFFRKGAVGAILQDHLSGREDRGEQVWGLLILEAWFRTFIEPGGTPRGSIA